jgi:NADH-ubiquinone oxidoreductase chain 5
LTKKWHFDQLGNELIIHRFMNFGYHISFQTLDKGSIEMFGPFGSASKLWDVSKSLSKLHSGMLFHYSFAMLFSIVFLLCFFIIFNTSWDTNSLIILLVFSYFICSIK